MSSLNRRRGKAGRAEQRWRGVSVSDGLAVGRVLRLHSGTRHLIYRTTLDPAEIEREARRFRAAVRLARRQLLAIKRRAERALGAEHAYIFDAHLLMLEDRKLIEDVESYVRDERVNAEWALKVVSDRLLAVYAEIKDEYLRGRSSDIEDVTRRLLFALSGEGAPSQRLSQDAVVVAEELMPSASAELDFAHVQAIASDAGGWTSHTAIMARGLGIPAVVGLRDIYRRARTGDEIIVDATTGEVILHPSSETSARYRADAGRHSGARQATTAGTETTGAESERAPLLTLDGEEIILRANVELPAEFAGVERYGARGIGLYRSEFLLSHHLSQRPSHHLSQRPSPDLPYRPSQGGAMPSEDEQCRAYIEIARLGGADGATVRMFDLGGDKMMLSGDAAGGETERNPALGLRAIRFSLRREETLRTQARAILRAAAHGRLQIVLPMISDITDVRRARRIIEDERARLAQEGQATGEVKIGAMIEVPAAVAVAGNLAREVDFFSLGTNDLVQYLLAVDRSNDEVAEWFRSLHPAVLESIKRTLDAARAARIPAVVCGEMAATPTYALILIGLGARDLSMTASSMPRVRRMVRALKAERAREIASECLACATADDVEEVVRQRLGGEWPELFPPESLPAPKERG